MAPSSADKRAPKPSGRSPDVDSQVVAQVEAAARGDQRAWNGLVDRYAGLVWSVARGYRLSEAGAADVSQATWLRLVENLDRLRDPAAIAGWLATTTRRECLRVVRRASRETMLDGDAWSLVDADEAPVDEALLHVERRREVREAFDPAARTPTAAAPAPRRRSADELRGDLRGAAIPIGSIGPTRRRCLEQLRCFLERSRGASRWDEAGTLAQAALAARPDAGQAAHALARVHYESGSRAAGLRWLDGWRAGHSL